MRPGWPRASGDIRNRGICEPLKARHASNTSPSSPPLSLCAGVRNMHRCTSLIIIKSVGSRQSGNVPIKIFCCESRAGGPAGGRENVWPRRRRILLSFHFQSTVVTDNIFHSCDNAAAAVAVAVSWSLNLPFPPARQRRGTEDFQHEVVKCEWRHRRAAAPRGLRDSEG